MRKQFKKQDQMVQTVFSNQHDAKFDHIHHYYALIEFDGKEHVYTYDCKFRVEADAYFQEQARIERGRVNLMNTFK